MIDKLSDDLVWYLSHFLPVSDSLKLGKPITDYYNPKALIIQRWYRKYKKIRELRYKILKNEFQLNKKIYNCFYLNIRFILYDLSKLKIKMNEYLSESYLNFYLKNNTNKDEIKNIFFKTREEFTYNNIKYYLKMLPVKMLNHY
jgi:hypothetical protein